MADTQVIDGGDVFSPSLFSQAKEIAAREGIDTSEKKEEIELTAEDVQWIPEALFYLLRWKLEARGMQLSEAESERLGRLWVRPIKRLLGSIKDLDIIVAVGATGSLLIGKALEYAATHPKQPKQHKSAEQYSSSAGSEGEGQDELSKGETAAGFSVVRH